MSDLDFCTHYVSRQIEYPNGHDPRAYWVVTQNEPYKTWRFLSLEEALLWAESLERRHAQKKGQVPAPPGFWKNNYALGQTDEAIIQEAIRQYATSGELEYRTFLELRDINIRLAAGSFSLHNHYEDENGQQHDLTNIILKARIGDPTPKEQP
jgi:hypothetical protein